MIEIYSIPVSKDRLFALSENERELLILLGYASNQVLMLEKILIFSTQSNPCTYMEQIAADAQTQMLIRITVGAVFEAWKLIQSRFLSRDIAKDYTNRIDEDGLKALNKLKYQFGNSAFLSSIRNNFGYHYPDTKNVTDAFQEAISDFNFNDFWKVYFSHHGFNSLFLFSEAIFAHGVAKQAKSADLVDAQKKLMNELMDAALNVVEFSRAFFAATWIKNFGDEIDAEEITKIEKVPFIDDVALPFFIEMPI